MTVPRWMRLPVLPQKERRWGPQRPGARVREERSGSGLANGGGGGWVTNGPSDRPTHAVDVSPTPALIGLSQSPLRGREIWRMIVAGARTAIDKDAEV